MHDKVTFINKDRTRFYSTLKQRVDAYFSENEISKHANGAMIFKTAVMFSLYFVPYVLIMTMGLPLWTMWFLAAVMGVGLAGIGMSVMHDANHGAYSSNDLVNRIVGRSLDIVGGDAGNWKIQHNILHHTYTNIYGFDDDVNDRMMMRFSPEGKHKRIQYFQVAYVFFFYSMMTLWWTTGKDIVQFLKFKEKKHQRENGKERAKSLVTIIAWKTLYYSYMVVLPLLILNITWWQLLVGFVTLHLVAGLILSLIFQLAHVVEETAFPVPDENKNIENEWAIHQLQTTADFGRNNPLLTFFAGGLNFQAVHHLFPRICHIHYPKIAPIIEKTANEFGIPYLYNPSFSAALASHVRLLRKLGSGHKLSLEL